MGKGGISLGYQESFIFSNRWTSIEQNNADTRKIIDIFKKLDVRTDRDHLGECVAKVTFNENFDMFEKGREVLWITGERQCQRDNFRLIDVYLEDIKGDIENYLIHKLKLSMEELEILYNIEIVFLDSFVIPDIPTMLDENNGITTIEKLNIQPERPPKMDIMERFVEKLMPSEDKIDNNYDGAIFGLEDWQEYDLRIKKVCKELNLPLQIDIELINISGSKLPNYLYSINGYDFASYHDTPHLDKKGTWYLKYYDQNLRKIARTLDDNGIEDIA